MEVILSNPFFTLFICIFFLQVTWYWWKISRKFFIFLFYFSKKKLKLKKSSWEHIAFNYGLFGPLGLANISVYLYILLIFLKFFIFKDLSAT